jgi:hypothetical protein
MKYVTSLFQPVVSKQLFLNLQYLSHQNTINLCQS